MADVISRVFVCWKNDVNPVLIIGAPGTGKEYVAEAILSKGKLDKRQNYIGFNCAALNEQLITSALFGHRKGAFTGATSDRKGLLEAADKGVFLDEIDKAPKKLQVDLLRYIRNREIQPIGVDIPKRVDNLVPLVFATSLDLSDSNEDKDINKDRVETDTLDLSVEALVRKKRQEFLGPTASLAQQATIHKVKTDQLLPDFLDRMRLFIRMPRLKDRLLDMPKMIQKLVSTHASKKNREMTYICGQTISFMLVYEWPRNIGELEHFLVTGIDFTDKDTIIWENCLRYYGDDPKDAPLCFWPSISDYVALYLGLDMESQYYIPFRIDRLQRVFENLIRLNGKDRTAQIDQYFTLQRTLNKGKGEAHIWRAMDFQRRSEFNEWRKENHLDF